MVLLLVAADIAMEQDEDEVGRDMLHACMDGRSDTLVILGLYT